MNGKSSLPSVHRTAFRVHHFFKTSRRRERAPGANRHSLAATAWGQTAGTWHSPAELGEKTSGGFGNLLAFAASSRHLRSPAFKLARLYGSRAVAPRRARAALLQAAAQSFNNPRAARRQTCSRQLLAGKTNFSQRPRLNPGARRRARRST